MKHQITFTIPGNHEDPQGNPIPKIKKTAHQYWTPQAQRYAAWKNYVVKCFHNTLVGPGKLIPNEIMLVGGAKPITLGKDQEARLDIMIWWANEKHADPESIFGSIADALFTNDKHVRGKIDFKHTETGKGRTIVSIAI